MAEPRLLVPPSADGLSLVPEALPALPGPVAFPLGAFNSSYKVSAFPCKSKGWIFIFLGQIKIQNTFPHSVHLLEDLKGRPDLKRQKKSLPEIRGFYYSYCLRLWLAPYIQILNWCINIYLKFSTFKYVLISEQDSRKNLAMVFLFYFDFIRVTKAGGIPGVMLVWFITILSKGKLASSTKWLNSNNYQTQAQTAF